MDFSAVTTAKDNIMLALCCHILEKRQRGHDMTCLWPNKTQIAKEWENKNFNRFLGENGVASSFSGVTLFPACQYKNSDDHLDIINDIVRLLLSSVENIQRGDFSALEWAINEISDNVLVHSESPVGGLILINKIDKKNKKVNFIVADCGKGITETLGRSLEGSSEVSVLDKAVKEGVTRDKNVGQGNGLYGSYEISHQGKGSFSIVSNHAVLLNQKEKLSVSRGECFYQGTVIDVIIDFSTKNLISRALKLNGEQYEPVDFIETGYEDDVRDQVNFKISDESSSYGTRNAGYPLRTRIINIERLFQRGKIVIDFGGLPVISSSFVDEIVGKLLFQVGEESFREKYLIICEDYENKGIIQRTVSQRLNDLRNLNSIAA
jgi:anti-sigma regulatory factor (Ser/Thr protein kinase)